MHHYVVRKWKYYLSSHVWLFATPWTVTRQAPLSMEFSRQEYWSGLPFPSPGIFLIPESSSGLLHCRWTLCYMNHRGSSPKVIPNGKFPKKFWVMSANFESNMYHHFVCSQTICFIFYKPWKQVERQKLVLSDQTSLFQACLALLSEMCSGFSLCDTVGSSIIPNLCWFLPLVSYGVNHNQCPPDSDLCFPNILSVLPTWGDINSLSTVNSCCCTGAEIIATETMYPAPQVSSQCLEQYYTCSCISVLILVEWMETTFHPHYTSNYSVVLQHTIIKQRFSPEAVSQHEMRKQYGSSSTGPGKEHSFLCTRILHLQFLITLNLKVPLCLLSKSRIISCIYININL